MVVAVAPVSDRHSSDLDGRLAPLDQTLPITVLLAVDDEVAQTLAGQHTAWMAVCLLARLDRVVAEVWLAVPSVPLLPGVVPYGAGETLDGRLLNAGNLIDRPRFRRDTGEGADRVVRIGPPTGNHELAVLGAGWWAGVSIDGEFVDWSNADLTSAVPFGPYLAACFAVGDLFLRARRVPLRGENIYGWDLLEGRPATTPVIVPAIEVDLSDVALAGVGAVGTAWMHALWAYPDAVGTVGVVDADEDGVDETNLNRGVLFVRGDEGHAKADTAASRVEEGKVQWEPRSGRFEDSEFRPGLLISAVDKNRPRDALQGLYPARIIGASTLDLRAEMLDLGQPGVGCCLRCFLELEPRLSDDATHARARADHDAVDQAARELQLDADEALSWLDDPSCGQVTPEFTERLRDLLGDPTVPQFSVGFVSVAAGVLLAAETIKVVAGLDGVAGPSSSLRLQFWNPSANAEAASMLRQDGCPRCGLTEPALGVWRERRRRFDEGRRSAH